jgi:hypothetical protein
LPVLVGSVFGRSWEFLALDSATNLADIFVPDIHNLECIHKQSEDFYTKKSLEEMRSLVLVSSQKSNGKSPLSISFRITYAVITMTYPLGIRFRNAI